MWLSKRNQAMLSPLPVDNTGLQAEIDFCHRQLLHFNAKLPMPRLEKNIKKPEWVEFDDGLIQLIMLREDLISVRERWADAVFKRPHLELWKL